MGEGKVAVLDDYRSLELIQDGKRKRSQERMRPDKGHLGEWQALSKASQSKTGTPIPLAEIVATHLAAFAAVASLRENRPVSVDADAFWQDTSSS
ncbi:MAG: hypothetical protein EOP04_14250 [Proteobacteria bacterium]|nr:MAG: hypothetical protein EOP04_14250 [Pseudomonadota bacterium]